MSGLVTPTGIKGPFIRVGNTNRDNPFVPVGVTTRDKRVGPFYPEWSHQPGQMGGLLSGLVAPPGTKGPTPFIPVGNTNPDKRVTLLSRLVVPTGTKGPFCPGWCYQPGQKAPPRDSSKGSYSLLSHMYYLVELARKPCARQ